MFQTLTLDIGETYTVSSSVFCQSVIFNLDFPLYVLYVLSVWVDISSKNSTSQTIVKIHFFSKSFQRMCSKCFAQCLAKLGCSVTKQEDGVEIF